VIVFRRLEDIKFLDEEHMLIAFLDCFFCHWALWEQGIEHGDISIGNLMCDPVTKRGVLNDFDLARLRVPDRKPSSKDHTGTLPFLALDLLNERAFNGQVPRLYRHDAESFNWCLVYVCICMKRDGNGQIGAAYPHPLSSWFTDAGNCYRSKLELRDDGLLEEFPIHQNIEPLVSGLYKHWTDRYHDQKSNLEGSSSGIVFEGLSKFIRPKAVQTTEPDPYKELSDHEWFTQIVQLIIDRSGVMPKSQGQVFVQIMGLVDTRDPFATSSGSDANESN